MTPSWLIMAQQAAHEWGPLLASLLHLALALAVCIHALLNKRDVHRALGWIALAWLVPVAGPLLYLMLGINRIHRAGVALGLKAAWQGEQGSVYDSATPDAPCRPELAGISRLTRLVTGKPLLAGNAATPLVNAEQAYPAMLKALEDACRSVTLLTYIFNDDEAGQAFAAALLRAQARGVQIRVLIDAVGARYSRVNMVKQLAGQGIRAAAFLPPKLQHLLAQANLRNHRKIMVVDGEFGFTGGMNIGAGHWFSSRPALPIQCLHFSVRGPVVTELQRAFAIDWAFTTGEILRGPTWFADNKPCGPVLARGVPDGPDADNDHMRQVMLGALAAAQRRVRIVTPYFLPDEVVLTTLQMMALRGVAVDIVLPKRSNLPLMDWAMQPQLRSLVESGCRVYLSGPPFDHTKLFVMDEAWSLIGSTNWDARSLRLNFEYNLECHDAQLVRALDVLVEQRIAGLQPLSGEWLARQSLGVQLRNRMISLLAPYL